MGIAPNPFYEGYWEVASDGGIFTYGSSGFFGSTGGIALHQPIVAMAPHPSGLGYWMVARDGGVFSFGASKFKGSTGGIALEKPIVGMAPTPSGNGYWLVATDGGIFSFGDAGFKGSLGGVALHQPIVDIDATPSGNGYRLVAADGGVFTFNAGFFGSLGGIRLDKPIVGMDSTPNGNGYWMVATDGGVFTFGNAPFRGSTGGIRLERPVIGFAARPPLSFEVDPFANDDASINRSSNWVIEGGDERLVLTHGGTGTAGGARILGVESLNVSQLGSPSFHVEAGTTCSGGLPALQIYADTNGDGAFDRTNVIRCNSAGPSTVRANPVTRGTNPLPANAVVTGMDMVYVGNSTVKVDDIQVAGVTVTDHRTFTAAGTTIG